jgi:hypothetical protein
MGSSQSEQNGQDDDAKNNMLTEEIDLWSNYEYALREEDRLLFNKMLSECKENEDLVRGTDSKYEFFSAESLFYGIDIAAAKNDKRIDCQCIRTKKPKIILTIAHVASYYIIYTMTFF